MTDGLEVVYIQSVEILPPPRPSLGLCGGHQVKLGELASQVDESYGNRLRLPLQTQAGAQTERTEGTGGERLASFPWQTIVITVHTYLSLTKVQAICTSFSILAFSPV